MSVATEYAPVVYIPPRARPAARPDAVVIPLFGPSASRAAGVVRLTRRGVAVLAATVALAGVALVLLAWRSAPTTPVPRSIPAVVTVQSGDTLWSIATQVAPNRDPRAEVADLQRLNHLGSVSVSVGQSLRTR
ncbi:MAG: LysM peptidoglycan-binding domain-containing protein [Jatrophihabitantaceae bacterium]